MGILARPERVEAKSSMATDRAIRPCHRDDATAACANDGNGLRVAVTMVLLAEELLGWDEEPPASRIGRHYLRLNRSIDVASL